MDEPIQLPNPLLAAWRELKGIVRGWFRRSRPPLHDDLLGTLTWDDNVQAYSGKFTDGTGDTITFSISPESPETVVDMLERCRLVLSHIDRYRAAAAEYAVKELLPLKNEAWLDEEEDDLTPDEFRARMRLESVAFGSSGCVTFYHDDDDMFCGHCIEIGMTATDNFNHADIPG